MTRFNLQSFIFAAIVLVFALFGRQGNGEAGFPVTSSIERTSLTAEAPFVADAAAILPLPSIPPANVPSRERVVFEVHPDAGQEKVDAPVLEAKAAAVMELGGGVPVFSKGYRNRWPIASLTKLMAALVAADALDANTVVTITERAAAEFGDTGGFRAGETFTVLDLTKAMLVGSSNDAAVALAESYGYEKFLNAMREKAFALGMFETTFADPNGISVLNQSTAEDLGKLANFIAEEHREIFTLTSLKSTEVTERNSGSVRAISTTNLFAGTKNFVGGKTGYTSDANGNLLSIFSNGQREFLVVVLGTSDRFGETEKLWGWTKKAEQL